MIPIEEKSAFRQSIVDEVVLGRKTSIWHEAVEVYKQKLWVKPPAKLMKLITPWKDLRDKRRKKLPNHYTTFRQSLISIRRLENDLRKSFRLRGMDMRVAVGVSCQDYPMIVHTDRQEQYFISFSYKIRNNLFPRITYSWLKEADHDYYDQFGIFVDDRPCVLTVKSNKSLVPILNATTPDAIQKHIELSNSYMKELIRRAECRATEETNDQE